MRVFTALPLPQEVQAILYKQTEPLRRTFPRLKWVHRESLHITLHFLGEIPNQKVTEISTALETAELKTFPFAVNLNGIGTFPVRGPARVVFANIREGSPGCRKLFSEITQQLKTVFPLPEVNFKPHVTLARVKRGNRWPSPEKYRKTPSISFKINKIVLYQSILAKTGTRYINLTEKILKTS